MNTTTFNDAQIEVLNAMAHIESNEELVELKEYLSKFFAAKAERELDKLWDSGKLNQAVLDNLRGQHLRTAYR